MNYKSFVGREKDYDKFGADFLVDLKSYGVMPSHNLVDIGCGSLRIGRHLISFLEPEKYHGIEPEKKWLNDALKHAVDSDLLKMKKPRFSHNADFDFAEFDTCFDVAIAHQVFIHCGVAQFERCLSNLHNHLGTRGSLFATIKIINKTTETAYRKKKRYKHSSHAKTKYSRSHFKKILKNNGYRSRELKVSPLNKEVKLFKIFKHEGSYAAN